VVSNGSAAADSLTLPRLAGFAAHAFSGASPAVSATYAVTSASLAESNASPGVKRQAVKLERWAHHATVGGTAQSRKSHDSIRFHSPQEGLHVVEALGAVVGDLRQLHGGQGAAAEAEAVVHAGQAAEGAAVEDAVVEGPLRRVVVEPRSALVELALVEDGVGRDKRGVEVQISMTNKCPSTND
jgi:hypothetical protein